MGSLPQSPTKIQPRSRDTGFPEPFCGSRNTTLPHPDANISPDACISADDIATNRVLNRQRRSFLINNKHRRTLSHGRITAEMERMYSDMTLLDEAIESPPLGATESNRSVDNSRPSKDGADSFASVEASSEPHVPQLRAPPGRTSPDGHGQRRRSVLHKLMHR